MDKCFEDAFIEAQTVFVDLCLDFTNGDVDMVYIFIYQSKQMETFNAFFKQDGILRYTSYFGNDVDVDELFDHGFDAIEDLRTVCKQYQKECPNEVRLTYNVLTKKFDAKYSYEDYVINGTKDADEELFQWMQCVKNE